MRLGIWWLAPFAAIALLAGARAAHAQTEPSSPTANVSTPDTAANDAKARAQEHLDRGNAFKSERSFEKALVEFRAAHDLYPSPKIFYNEADAESELGRFVDAAAHYDAFLREFSQPEDDEDAQRIQAAKEGVAAARAKIATIDLDVSKGVEVLLDAHSLGKAPLVDPLRVDPGPHRFSFRRPGLADSNRDVVLSPGERLRVAPDPITFAKEGPPPPKPIWRRWPFWAIAGAAVLTGVATVFVVDYYSRPGCPVPGHCWPAQ
jgi:hypothetical protein